MTPERLKTIELMLETEGCEDAPPEDMVFDIANELAVALRAAWAERDMYLRAYKGEESSYEIGRKVEREECAKLAESFDKYVDSPRREIAEAIRARGKESTE